jgi:hypothetical protein
MESPTSSIPMQQCWRHGAWSLEGPDTRIFPFARRNNLQHLIRTFKASKINSRGKIKGPFRDLSQSAGTENGTRHFKMPRNEQPLPRHLQQPSFVVIVTSRSSLVSSPFSLISRTTPLLAYDLFLYKRCVSSNAVGACASSTDEPNDQRHCVDSPHL